MRAISLDGLSRVEQQTVRTEFLIEACAPHHVEDARVEAHEPEGDGDPPCAFLQQLQSRVLDVGDAAQVEGHDARFMLRNQRPDLVGDVLRVGEVQTAFGAEIKRPSNVSSSGCSGDRGRRTSAPRLRAMTETRGMGGLAKRGR